MPVVAPGRRAAYPPIGRLRTSPLSGGGKKNMFVSLNLTPMVDMFTILVIFLIQLFKATGQVELRAEILVPKSITGPALEDQGVVIAVYPPVEGQGTVILVDGKGVPTDQMGNELQADIPGLVEMLKKKKEFQEELDKRAGIVPDPSKPFDKPLLVQADIKADFKVVRRIIGSANIAGWSKFKFVTTPDAAAIKAAEAAAGGAPAEGGTPP